MKLSLNFVKDYIDIKADSEEEIIEIAEAMTKAGNEYDDAGKLIEATNLVIGEVKECEMHPDSDHLHVCKVDVGGGKILQIVCGAPNCRKGIKVIVALDGAKLPGGEIKKGNIRGVESNGMMCSIAELGLDNKFLKPEDKEGIHELPENAPLGEDPIKFMGMEDGVIDFELTANRGDLLSILGMAYELGAIYGLKVKDVDTKYTEVKDDFKDNFKVNVNTENCGLFLAKYVKNVKIKESPDFIKNRLIASGIRPINNVVDISNYVMLEVGQPLHYYDYDTLKGQIEVRMAKEGEKLITLDEQERTLSENDIVISDGTKAIGLAGVMGGLDTEITEGTKNILIEAAIFNSVLIRKTSKTILRSEASNRFEKGLDPNRTYLAIERSCALLEKYADAEIAEGMVAYDNVDKDPKKIEISYDKINKVLGTTIEAKDVKEVFEKLGFETKEIKVDGLEGLEVTVPTRRIDISIPEDLIEEVGRIYGVDNIQGHIMELPLKEGSYDTVTRAIRNKMVDLGLNETLSYILVNDKEAKDFSPEKENDIIPLLDPMTEDRNTLRYSVLPSLFKIYKYNVEHYNKNISIFEIGKAFKKIGNDYDESNHLAALMTGDFYLGIGHKMKVDFFVMKGIVEEILDFLGYENRYSLVAPKTEMKEFHPGQVAEINLNGKLVGVMGRVHPTRINEVGKGLDPVFVMDIDLAKLLDNKTGKMKYKEYSKFPEVKKDLAMLVNSDVASIDIAKDIKKAAGSLLQNVEVFDVYQGKGIEDGKKSIAFSLTFGANDRTLTDEEVNDAINKVLIQCEKAGYKIRS